MEKVTWAVLLREWQRVNPGSQTTESREDAYISEASQGKTRGSGEDCGEM